MSDLMRGYSFMVRAPEGTHFIHIADDDKGDPSLLMINCGKSGSTAMAWASFTSQLISELLTNKKMGLADIAALASGNRSDKFRYAVDSNMHVRVFSGPEAIAFAIGQYIHQKRVDALEDVMATSRQITRELDSAPASDVIVGPLRGARRLKTGERYGYRTEEENEVDD